MKKIICLFFALFMCSTIMNPSAKAFSVVQNKDVMQSDFFSSQKVTVDLSEGKAAVDLDVNASNTVASVDNYSTNSKQIKIKLKSSQSITVKVSLYDTSGNYIGGETKDVGTFLNTTWTFTNLTQSKIYYFEVKNVGQKDVHLTGTVSD